MRRYINLPSQNLSIILGIICYNEAIPYLDDDDHNDGDVHVDDDVDVDDDNDDVSASI